MSQLFSPTHAGSPGSVAPWSSAGRYSAEPAQDRTQWSAVLSQSLQPAERSASSARSDAADRAARKSADKPSKAADKAERSASRQAEESSRPASEAEDVALDQEESSDDTQTSAQELANALVVPQAETSDPASHLALSAMNAKGNTPVVGLDAAAMQNMQAAQATTEEGDGQQEQQSSGHHLLAMAQTGNEENSESSEAMATAFKPLPSVGSGQGESSTQPTAAVTAISGPDASTPRTGEVVAPAGLPVMDEMASEEMDPNVARVAQGLRGALNLKGGAVTIRLNPAELGLVRIEMEIQGGSVKAELQSENASVRDLLTHQLGRLRETLQSRGLAVERLEVNAPMAPDASQSGHGEQDSAGDGRSRGQFFNQQQSSQQREQGGERSKARSTFGRMLVDMVG